MSKYLQENLFFRFKKQSIKMGFVRLRIGKIIFQTCFFLSFRKNSFSLGLNIDRLFNNAVAILCYSKLDFCTNCNLFRGYAFITFTNRDEAQEAVNQVYLTLEVL